MNISLLRRCLIGTFMEYFDFVLFALLAPTLTTHVYSSATQMEQQFISTLLIAATYWGRPLFAHCWSLVAHYCGLGQSMKHNLIMMALANLLLALCPSGETFPHLAPWWLAISRMLQIIAFSGEFTTSLLILSQESRAYSALLITSSSLGFACASFIAHLTNQTPWWPVPFLVSALFLLLNTQGKWQSLQQLENKRRGSIFHYWKALPFAAAVISFQLLPTWLGGALYVPMMQALLALALMYPLIMLIPHETKRHQILTTAFFSLLIIAAYSQHILAITLTIQSFIGLSFYRWILPLARTQPIWHFGLGYQLAFMSSSSLLTLISIAAR